MSATHAGAGPRRRPATLVPSVLGCCLALLLPLLPAAAAPPGVQLAAPALDATTPPAARPVKRAARPSIPAPDGGAALTVGPLVFAGLTIDDDLGGNSSGNSNGAAEAGETVELFVALQNAGADQASGVAVHIHDDSPYLNDIFNTASDYGDIPGGATADNLNDFDYDIDTATPDGHVVTFTIDITAANGGPWSDTFQVIVHNAITGPVTLISDQTELNPLAPVLAGAGFTPLVLDNNWNGTQGIFTADLAFLRQQAVVVWYASGYGNGRLITQQEHDALADYLQEGGRLLVTGYDTLGDPDDALLADLVRSSTSGDGPFESEYQVATLSHPIMGGPFGHYVQGFPLHAANSDHDQTHADLARGAEAIAEFWDGTDKIIATNLSSSPASGRVVYWNGNYDAEDWRGRTMAPLRAAVPAEEKARPGQDGRFSNAALEARAQRVAAPAAGANAAPGASGSVLSEALLAELRDSARQAALRADQTFPFPGSAATYTVAAYPAWYSAGDAVEETVTLGLSAAESVHLDLVVSENYLFGAQIDLGLWINGELVGQFGVQQNQFSVHVDFDFQPIEGPVFTLRLQEMNTVPQGAGSIVIPPDLSTARLTRRQTDIFLNTLAWLAEGAATADPHEPNDDPSTCTSIGYEQPVSDAVIAPPGDQDIFCFAGSAGSAITARVDAQQLGSMLDPVLALLDTDGQTVLVEDDDTHGLDPFLQYTLPASGDYFLRVRSSGHPCCGGPAFTYTLTLGTPAGPVAGGALMVDDDTGGSSNGNGDGIVQAGETVELLCEIENAGGVPLTGVSACVSEDSPHVQGFLANTCSPYADLPPGALGTNQDAFELTVDPTAPTGHVVHVTLTVNANEGGPWEVIFPVEVERSDPEIEIPHPPLEFHLPANSTDTGTLSILNRGFSQSLIWQVAEPCSWLAASPTSGPLPPGGQQDIDIAVDTSGLSPGDYTCTLQITSDDVDEPLTEFYVLLTVEGPECPPVCNPPAVVPADLLGTHGDTGFVDVRVESPADPIQAFSFELRFDPAALDFLDHAEPGDLTQGFVTVDASENTPGLITCGGFGTTPIPAGTSGSIIRLQFQITCAGCAGGDTAEFVVAGLADDLAAMNACCSLFTYTDCPHDGDVNGDQTLSAGDALCAFKAYLNGQVVSPDCDVAGDCEVAAGDVDCNGTVTAGDALAIFERYLDGDPPAACFAAPPLAAAAAAEAGPGAVIELGTPRAAESERQGDLLMVVPIDVASAPPRAFGVAVRFDAELLEFAGIERGALARDWTALDARAAGPGLLRLGGFEPHPGGEPGELARLLFRVAGAPATATAGARVAIAEITGARAGATTAVTVEPSALAPAAPGIERVFPNPTRGTATITLGVPGDGSGSIEVAIYDVAGRRVRTLLRGAAAPGRHRLTWDGRNARGAPVGAGVYFVMMRGDGVRWSNKLLVLR